MFPEWAPVPITWQILIMNLQEKLYNMWLGWVQLKVAHFCTLWHLRAKRISNLLPNYIASILSHASRRHRTWSGFTCTVFEMHIKPTIIRYDSRGKCIHLKIAFIVIFKTFSEIQVCLTRKGKGRSGEGEGEKGQPVFRGGGRPRGLYKAVIS